MENFPAFTDYILVFIFGIVLPFVSGLRSASVFKELKVQFSSDTKRRFYLGNSFLLFLVAAIVMLVWALYQRPFTELGFITPAEAGKSTQWWMIGLFVLLYALDMIYSITDNSELEKTIDNLEDQTPFMPTKYRELPGYIVMCISAGVFEEIVFRGYLITFFKYLLQGIPAASTWAVLTPALVFSIAHYYQGARAVFKILVLSLLFGMIFWHSGSLYAVIALHFLVDFVSGLLSIHLAKNKKES